MRFILPFFNSPGDNDSKTHLTFEPRIDQVTAQNMRQTDLFLFLFKDNYKWVANLGLCIFHRLQKYILGEGEGANWKLETETFDFYNWKSELDLDII